MVGKLLLLGFLHTGRQLLVLGGLRPLHAIDGTVEALGREAGSGLGFGFEGHVSGRVRIVEPARDCADTLWRRTEAGC